MYTCACTVMQHKSYVHVHQPRTLKVMGSSPTRGSIFFERLLPWDLICISFLCLSQVSEYLSCTYSNMYNSPSQFHFALSRI